MRIPEPVDPAVAAAVLRMVLLSQEGSNRLDLQKQLLKPGVELLAFEGDDYLLKVRTEVREEYEHYRFFFMGRLFEMRRIGFCSSDYSLVEFPSQLEQYRTMVQERFAALLVTTQDGLGWMAPGRWEELTEAQKAIYKPKYVKDGLRYCSM